MKTREEQQARNLAWIRGGVGLAAGAAILLPYQFQPAIDALWTCMRGFAVFRLSWFETLWYVFSQISVLLPIKMEQDGRHLLGIGSILSVHRDRPNRTCQACRQAAWHQASSQLGYCTVSEMALKDERTAFLHLASASSRPDNDQEVRWRTYARYSGFWELSRLQDGKHTEGLAHSPTAERNMECPVSPSLYLVFTCPKRASSALRSPYLSSDRPTSCGSFSDLRRHVLHLSHGPP